MPYEGPERRAVVCDSCVKADFNTVKKLVFIILVAVALNTTAGGFVVLADNDKDAVQDSRITAVETNQAVIIENQKAQNEKLDKLIDLSVQTNLAIQTHIASDD